jgi:hypothetical protein
MLSLMMILRVYTRRVVTVRTWVTFSVTLVAGLAAVAALILTRGTTVSALLDGVLLQPMRHPSVYFFAVNWRPGAGLVALLSLAFAAWTSLRGLGNDSRVREIIAWTRVGAAIAFLATNPTTFDSHLPGWGMSYGISLAWIFVIPLGAPSYSAAIRAWLSLVLVFQFLHAYPVAGSQVNWGTFLWVPLLALGLHDAGPTLQQRFRNKRWSAAIPMIAIVAVTVAMIAPLAKIGRERYANSPRLGLPGAEDVRLPTGATARYRALALNAAAHGDELFSLPGMFSFNLWTDLPTPTSANVTHWFSLLSEAQQREAIAALEGHPRACVIVQTTHLAYLKGQGLGPRGPLYDYIQHSFETAFELDGFEFRVRRGRHVAALLTAELFEDRSGAEAYDTLIKMQLLLPAGQSIASIEIASMSETPGPSLILSPSSIKVTAAPMKLNGEPTADSSTRTLPLALNGPSQVWVHFNRGDAHISPTRSIVILRDAAGQEVGLVRLLP